MSGFSRIMKNFILVSIITVSIFVFAFIALHYTAKIMLEKTSENCPRQVFENAPPCNSEKLSIFEQSESPFSQSGKVILNKYFSESEKQLILPMTRDKMPGWKYHPSLVYIRGDANNNAYRVGKYGIRTNGATISENDLLFDKAIEEKKAIFIFGGSTVEGHGLVGSASISKYLQDLVSNKGYQVFNFGIGAYDLERQNQLLSYLLRIGITPQIVVYLDGLNDIGTHARSRFIPEEKLVYHGWHSAALDSSYKLLENKNTILHRLLDKFFNLAIFRLMRTKEESGEKIPPYGVSAFASSEYRPDLEDTLFRNGLYFADNYKEELINGLLSSFGNHDAYAKSLAKGFGFKFYHFYQPIGIVHENNKMHKPNIKTSFGYDYFKSAHLAIKNYITHSENNIIDLSSVLEKNDVYDYFIDSSHYSPKANNIIAHNIYEHIIADIK